MIEGTQVGAYRILKRIGAGGMGEVWMAEHALLGRRAAIKLLHPMFSTQPDVVSRFFNEARAATSIADPGIVQIFDFGHHTDGAAYIVMELLDGETLDARLRNSGALAVADTLRIMRQIASSLGAAHVRGIVHRDLKPENIFLVRDPEVASGERAKILDFGIAKLTGDPNSKTQASVVMGTPMFMSPEQCRGAGQVDQRSDIYSLGCMLYMLLTGRPPFDAVGAGELIALHLLEPAPRTSSRAVGVPPAVDALIARCLEKDPARRFASGAELATAIGALLGTAPSAGAVPAIAARNTPVPVGAAQTTLSTAAGMSMPSATPTPKRSRGWLVAGVAVAAIGGVAYIAVRGSYEAKPTAIPSAVIAAPLPAAPPSTPAAKPSAPDPNVVLTNRMKAMLTSFVTWSHDHVGAPCPDTAALGDDLQDPWGHPFKITCTDQPADEMIGAISAGPDGVFGTPDDVASWRLDRDVCAIVRGARWVVARPKPEPAIAVKSVTKKSTAAAATSTKKAPSAIADPISNTTKPAKLVAPEPKKPATSGVQLDENGMPISR